MADGIDGALNIFGRIFWACDMISLDNHQKSG
jgi:hypothetical protein